MRFGLELSLARRERSLERLVALLGRRGCEIVGARADLADDESSLVVALELESDRSPELVARQVARLYDVRSARVVQR